uniref:Transposase MuDR plant domain-containing protein n=1 Tax=Chenopodium quinoa TaxID=63459 RepID=A0A803MJJ6_CHEQI
MMSGWEFGESSEQKKAKMAKLTSAQEMDLKPCLVVHHGGEWQISSGAFYVGGKINVFDNLPDNIDGHYVKGLIEGLGYNDIVKLHFLDPKKDLNSGIRYLSFESRLCDPFLSLLLEYRLIHIYTEHDQPATPLFNHGRRGQFMSLLTDNNVSEVIGERIQTPRVTQPFTVDENVFEPTQIPRATQSDIDYDTEGTDEDDEEFVKARDDIAMDKKNQHSYEDELDMLRKVAASKGLGEIRTDFEEFSDIESPNESEDDDDCGYLVAPPNNKVRKVAKAKDDECIEDFFPGQQFDNPAAFKQAVKNHSIKLGRNIPFTKNDKQRVGAECENKLKGCPWRIWASWDRNKTHFTVKSHVSQHKCGRSPRVKKM